MADEKHTDAKTTAKKIYENIKKIYKQYENRKLSAEDALKEISEITLDASGRDDERKPYGPLLSPYICGLLREYLEDIPGGSMLMVECALKEKYLRNILKDKKSVWAYTDGEESEPETVFIHIINAKDSLANKIEATIKMSEKFPEDALKYIKVLNSMNSVDTYIRIANKNYSRNMGTVIQSAECMIKEYERADKDDCYDTKRALSLLIKPFMNQLSFDLFGKDIYGADVLENFNIVTKERGTPVCNSSLQKADLKELFDKSVGLNVMDRRYARLLTIHKDHASALRRILREQTPTPTRQP